MLVLHIQLFVKGYVFLLAAYVASLHYGEVFTVSIVLTNEIVFPGFIPGISDSGI